MWGLLGLEELLEFKGNGVYLVWFFLEILVLREILEIGVLLVLLVE